MVRTRETWVSKAKAGLVAANGFSSYAGMTHSTV